MIIEVKGITKTYNDFKAIDRISFSVEEGEIFGFLGPNGAGKSTTIKILTTLISLTEGSACVCGKDVKREAQHIRRMIGYVAQETGVDYSMTGMENLVLQGRMYHMGKKDIITRVDELVDIFDLKDDINDMVSSYSGGMRRRLDISTALIHKPRLLFLDEPTLGLDPVSRNSLWKYIQRLNKEFRITIFLTTHYLEEADRLSKRVGIIDKGQIQVIDAPESLKDGIRGDLVTISFDTQSNNGYHLMNERVKEELKGFVYIKDIISEGRQLRIYVENGGEAVPVILKRLTEQGLPVKGVSISRPTLDDVFLKYTGRSIENGEKAGDTPNQWWLKWQKGAGSKTGSKKGKDVVYETNKSKASEWQSNWQTEENKDNKAWEGKDNNWDNWDNSRTKNDKAEVTKWN